MILDEPKKSRKPRKKKAVLAESPAPPENFINPPTTAPEPEDVGFAFKKVEPITEKPRTVKCPFHKFPLVLQTADHEEFAVCNCAVVNNLHSGKKVYVRRF